MSPHCCLGRHGTTRRHGCVLFHTSFCAGSRGFLACTGCSGPQAARLSIMKAARQLAAEAGVYVLVRKFQVRSSLPLNRCCAH